MYFNSESEYWKEQFSRLVQKNMDRTDGEKFDVEHAQDEFRRFSSRHPEIQTDAEFFETYCIWEVFVTGKIKLRFFLQQTVKASLFEFSNGEYVKIADAKFPHNPFPEIEDFVLHSAEYEKEICGMMTESARRIRQNRIAKEFVNSYLSARLRGSPNVIWRTEACADGVKLFVENGHDTGEFVIPAAGFQCELEKILSTIHI